MFYSVIKRYSDVYEAVLLAGLSPRLMSYTVYVVWQQYCFLPTLVDRLPDEIPCWEKKHPSFVNNVE